MKSVKLILTLSLFCLALALNAQATYDGNGVFVNPPDGLANTTVSSFVVPAGEDRVLLIHTMTDNGFVASVSYNTVAGVEAVSAAFSAQYTTAVWYVLLGSGPEITSDVLITYNVATTNDIAIGVASFANVDQASPISDTQSHTNTPAAMFTYATTSDDLVVDAYAGGCDNADVVPGSNQTEIIEGFTTCGIGYGVAISSASDPSTSTSWSGSFASIASGVALNGVAVVAAVPTLSQWGIIILSLLVLVFGIVMIKQTETVLA